MNLVTAPAATLAPGATTTFSLTITPLGTGSTVWSFDITLDNNDIGERPFNLLAFGSVVDPPVLSTGSAIELGDMVVNPGVGTTAPLTILNLGGDPLVISGVTFSTPVNGTATLSSPPAFPITLGSGVDVTLIVLVEAADEGAFSTTASIASNDPATPTTTVALTGNGVEPEIDVALGSTPVVDQGTVDVGTVAAGATTQTTYTISNTGSGPLSVGAISFEGAPASGDWIPLVQE